MSVINVMFFFTSEVKNSNCYDIKTGHQYNVDSFGTNCDLTSNSKNDYSLL